MRGAACTCGPAPHNRRVLSLDDLASDWLRPADEADFSLPAIVNFRGTAEAAWGVSGIQNWDLSAHWPRDADRAALLPRRRSHPPLPARGDEDRWKAYEIERRGHGVTTSLRMPAGRDAAIERLRFELAGVFYLVFTGLPRVWRFTDYWNLPPEDVPMLERRAGTATGFQLDDTKTFGRRGVRGARRLARSRTSTRGGTGHRRSARPGRRRRAARSPPATR